MPSSTRGDHCLKFEKLATYRTSTNPLSLAVMPATSSNPTLIAVADLMKSLSILQVSWNDESSSTGYTLLEVSRHFASLWSSATAAIMKNEWVVADMEGNLITLRQVKDGNTPSGFSRRLETTGEFRLGEVVNKIVSLSANPTPVKESWAQVEGDPAPLNRLAREGPLVTPRAFLAKVEGSIYMLGTINPTIPARPTHITIHNGK